MISDEIEENRGIIELTKPFVPSASIKTVYIFVIATIITSKHVKFVITYLINSACC